MGAIPLVLRARLWAPQLPLQLFFPTGRVQRKGLPSPSLHWGQAALTRAQCPPPPGTVTTATGSGLKPLLCALAPVTAELPEAHLWGTQKGLSREHHPWALSSNQGGFKPQVGVSRVPGYPSRSQRDKGEAGACDKSPTRGREKPGFTPSRRHPLSSQAHPRPGTQRSWSFFWWM